MRRSRRWLASAALLVATAGLSCGDGATGPVAGTLSVDFAATTGGTHGAVMFTVSGPAAITSATAPAGLRVFFETFGPTSTTFVVTGAVQAGSILSIGVPDVNQVGQYTAAIQQVAAADHSLRPLGTYTLTLAR